MDVKTNCLVALALTAALVPATARAGTQEEVGHLLYYIENSGCTSVRNGKEHASRKAREHIENKYTRVREQVRTAEDFIRHAASRSSMSGRAYRVHCEGDETPTAKWLKEELERFRRQ